MVFTISRFRAKTSNSPEVSEQDLEGLCELLTTFYPCENKDDAPLWSPAVYAPGSARKDENVIAISCLALDFDSGIGWEDFVQEWHKLTFIIHTTHSHSREHPKWRAVFPLAHPVPAADWKSAFERLSKALSFGNADPACKNLSRIYFLPSHAADAPRYRTRHEGELLNPDEPTKEEPVHESETKVGDAYDKEATWDEIFEPCGWHKVEGRKYCGVFDLWSRPGKEAKLGEHSARTGVGTAGDRCIIWTSTGVEPRFVKVPLKKWHLYAVLRFGGDFKSAIKELAGIGYGNKSKRKSAVAAAPPDDEPEPSGKAVIADLGGANPLDLEATLASIVSIMQSVNMPPIFFIRSGYLVKIVTDGDSPRITHYTADSLIDALAPHANWVKLRLNGKAEKIFPPKHILELLLQRSWGAETFPELNGVVNHPVLRSGSMNYNAGYDPESKLFVWSSVPKLFFDGNSLDEFFDEYLCDFNFKDEASKANFLAFALLPFVRHFIKDSVPFHVISAPAYGMGKSLLSDLGVIPANGHVCSTTAFSKDEDTLKKKVDNALNSSAEFVYFDNLDGVINSQILAQVLTNGRWAFTPFFTQGLIELEINSIFLGCGKNTDLHPELARRTLLTSLTSNVEDPTALTGFKHEDVRGYMIQTRERACGLLCGAIDYWVSKGMPLSKARPKGSFVRWSQIMGGILECNGITGFRDNEASLQLQANASTEMFKEFFKEILAEYGSAELSSSELAAFANERKLLRDWQIKGEITGVGLGRKLTQMEDFTFSIGEDDEGGEDVKKMFRLHLHRGRSRSLSFKIIDLSSSGEDGEDNLVINACEKNKEKDLFEEK